MKIPIVPIIWHNNTSHTPDHWIQFWNRLNQENKKPLGSIAYYHQFALDNYQWPLCTGPINTRNTCSFCSQLEGDNLIHHICECPTSLELWRVRGDHAQSGTTTTVIAVFLVSLYQPLPHHTYSREFCS